MGTGREFPWYPKPVSDLKNGPGSVNEVATLMVFCETSEGGTEKAKAAGEEDPEIAVMIVTSAEGLSGRIRGMVSLPAVEESSKLAPQLVLLDIPDKGGFYTGPEGDISAEVVRKFLADYSAKTLTRQQLG